MNILRCGYSLCGPLLGAALAGLFGGRATGLESSQAKAPSQQSGAAAEVVVGVEAGIHEVLPKSFQPLSKKIPFHEGHIIGYSASSTIVEKSSSATLTAEAGYRFVVVEIEYTRRPVAFYPPWFDEVLLSTDTKSQLWFGLPMRSKFITGLAPATFSPIVFPKGVTVTAERYPVYVGVPFYIERSATRFMLRFRDHYTGVMTFEGASK